MMANTMTDRALAPQDYPHVPDAALTTPIMDTETVFRAARPYQDGDMSAYSPSADGHRPLYHQPPQRRILAGTDVPENANPDDSMIDQVPPTIPQINQLTPVLAADSGPPSTQQPSGVLTGNARGSSLPDMKIGRNEALMRIGGAIMGGASEGGLAAMQAGTQAYGAIQDANRQADADVFAIEEARRQAIADRMAAASKGGSAASEGSPEAIGDVRSAIAKLQVAQDMFTQDPDSSLTGYNWEAIYSRLTGRAIGNADEAKRLFLNEVRLDSVMNRVAETKGAISNAEMKLFASQAPTLDSNDIVWKDWLDRQLLLQKKILRRLRTGKMIDPDAPLDADLQSEQTPAVDLSQYTVEELK